MTEKQRQLLKFIADYVDVNGGMSPSYDEMRDFLDFKSKSGVFRLINALENAGHITRRKGCARSTYVTALGRSRLTPTTFPFTDMDDIEHALYHALVPRIERLTKWDPCPAIRLAGEWSREIAEEMSCIIVSEKKRLVEPFQLVGSGDADDFFQVSKS